MSNIIEAPTYRSGNCSVAADGSSATLGARASALGFLQKLAIEVSSGSIDLPCFPDVVIHIRKALADPTTTPEQTVTIVGAEPRLAAKLLQTANSAAFNPSGKPLTELRTAITRLGHQLVQAAAMAFAVQQMKDEESLRSIAQHLIQLWKKSITVASICQVVARRTKVPSDTAFLSGLLHGIGRLYVMARGVGHAAALNNDPEFKEMVNGWHPSIGQAVLENWGFAEELADAVGAQEDYERKSKQVELADVLIVSIVLADALEQPAPRAVAMDGIFPFRSIGLSDQDCAAILLHAEYQLGSIQSALGC